MLDRKEEYNKIAEKIVGHVENGTTDQAPDILKVQHQIIRRIKDGLLRWKIYSKVFL